MTENDRIKMIRKDPRVNLTMEKFGERIGVRKTTISGIENGAHAVTPQMRRSICREFRVNETWLETGEGEMFLKDTEFSLDEFLREHDADQLEVAIVKAYFELDPDLRRLVLKQFKANLERDQESVEDLESDYEKSTRKNSGSASNTDSSASSTIADA